MIHTFWQNTVHKNYEFLDYIIYNELPDCHHILNVRHCFISQCNNLTSPQVWDFLDWLIQLSDF
jgi:hypothetical protein